MAEAIIFRPARPAWRELAQVGFLGLLLVILVPTILSRPDFWSLVGLTGLALLVAGGAWLIFRLRFPGSPRLEVDAEGLRYHRFGRERSLAWSQVSAIHVYHDRQEMRFLAADGKPVIVHRDMVSSDGRRFDMLIEDYWQPPE
jgi:hypothetical protein